MNELICGVASAQYCPTFGCCCLSRLTAALNWFVVELVRVRDTQAGLVGLQVNGGIRDVDRIVVHADLALVLRCLSWVEHHRPRGRGRLDTVRVPHQEVSPTAVRDPVVGPVERVVRLVLEVVENRLVVRHQVGVDRGDVTTVDELRCRVARRRDAVPLAGAHQVDHLVRGAGLLQLDLAARLLLEVGLPRVGDVSRPGDEVQLPLTGPDGLLGGAVVVLLLLLPPHPATTNIVAASPPTIAAGSQAERALNLLTFLPPLPLRRRSDPLAIQFSLCGRVLPGPPRRSSPGSGGRFGAVPLLRGRRDSA